MKENPQNVLTLKNMHSRLSGRDASSRARARLKKGWVVWVSPALLSVGVGHRGA